VSRNQPLSLLKKHEIRLAMTERTILSEGAMNRFSIGERVVLKACTDFPGTVTGVGRGKVAVRFDDFSNEAPKAFRPDSLQLTKRKAQR
jgi:hypothetical protein